MKIKKRTQEKQQAKPFQISALAFPPPDECDNINTPMLSKGSNVSDFEADVSLVSDGTAELVTTSLVIDVGEVNKENCSIFIDQHKIHGE